MHTGPELAPEELPEDPEDPGLPEEPELTPLELPDASVLLPPSVVVLAT